MPVYVYRCETCGIRFEFARKFSEVDNLPDCPAGHKNVKRQFLAPVVVYKGSGWYSTDNRASTNKSD